MATLHTFFGSCMDLTMGIFATQADFLNLAIFCANILARFLALVTTMVTKVDHGNYGWLPRLVTMVSYLGYQGANYGY